MEPKYSYKKKVQNYDKVIECESSSWLFYNWKVLKTFFFFNLLRDKAYEILTEANTRNISSLLFW